jgi:hypothetical protein
MEYEDEENQLEWRDTYFILFQRSERPTLTQVEAAISDATSNIRLENLEADEDGLFESILVHVPDDNAALEISFEAGEAVLEQCTQLAQQLQSGEDLEPDQFAALLRADARLDVMHFERVTDDTYGGSDDEDDEPEALDPASLLTVVEALAKLTGGLPIDPGSGALMS